MHRAVPVAVAVAALLRPHQATAQTQTPPLILGACGAKLYVQSFLFDAATSTIRLTSINGSCVTAKTGDAAKGLWMSKCPATGTATPPSQNITLVNNSLAFPALLLPVRTDHLLYGIAHPDVTLSLEVLRRYHG